MAAEDRRPGLGQPKGHGGHDEDDERVVIHNHVSFDLSPVTASLQRLEALLNAGLGRIEAAIGGLKEQMATELEQLQGLAGKLDSLTTAFGNAIQSAVDRLTEEIQKQGNITPEVQGTLDHLSGTADGLIALNANLVDAFAKKPPEPVPPAPQPIPEPVPVPEPTPEPTPPLESRRR